MRIRDWAPVLPFSTRGCANDYAQEPRTRTASRREAVGVVTERSRWRGWSLSVVVRGASRREVQPLVEKHGAWKRILTSSPPCSPLAFPFAQRLRQEKGTHS
ncbi:MAG: hypothetical protein V7K77_10540 [Nostoc sp.]|uniref:hypothetical protein n=1 Tax=Nostoc sp. TaxID=1180 RepID=UPI002FFC8B61